MAGWQLEIPELQEGEQDGSITDKQKAFIKALCSETGLNFPEATLNDLGKWQASAVIEQIQSLKRQLTGQEDVDTDRLVDEPSGSNAGDGINWTTVGIIAVAAVVLLWLFFV